MTAEPAFVDTNVLVYATRRPAAEHGRAVAALSRLEDEGAELWISRQVLREYLAAVTRPQATAPALPIAVAVADVRRLVGAFAVAEDGPAVTDRLLDLVARFPTGGRQVHGAQAARPGRHARSARCRCSSSTPPTSRRPGSRDGLARGSAAG